MRRDGSQPNAGEAWTYGCPTLCTHVSMNAIFPAFFQLILRRHPLFPPCLLVPFVVCEISAPPPYSSRKGDASDSDRQPNPATNPAEFGPVPVLAGSTRQIRDVPAPIRIKNRDGRRLNCRTDCKAQAGRCLVWRNGSGEVVEHQRHAGKHWRDGNSSRICQNAFVRPGSSGLRGSVPSL